MPPPTMLVIFKIKLRRLYHYLALISKIELINFNKTLLNASV